MAQRLERLPPMRETWVQSLGQEDPREKEMTTHSSTPCLENPMDRGAWQARAHGVAKSRTQLSDFTFTIGFAQTILKVKVTQLCLSLCDPMDYTVHGILQARILERIARPFSRSSSQPRDRTQVSCIAGGFFTI